MMTDPIIADQQPLMTIQMKDDNPDDGSGWQVTDDWFRWWSGLSIWMVDPIKTETDPTTMDPLTK